MTVSGFSKQAWPQVAQSPRNVAEHLAGFWRTRMESALARLEWEAQRMLQLEAELSRFAGEYYAAVGEATERLAAVEEQLGGTALPHDIAQVLPEMLASREMQGARQVELKTRYRQLVMQMHPDRSQSASGASVRGDCMHVLNAAYERGDLAALLRIEAEVAMGEMMATPCSDTYAIESALREVERAADTYAQSYRAMLSSPLNELMLRAMSARLAGWDWMQAVVNKVERAIEEKERAMIEASIAKIAHWREEVQQPAVA